jgi:hypothetical protein
MQNYTAHNFLQQHAKICNRAEYGMNMLNKLFMNLKKIEVSGIFTKDISMSQVKKGVNLIFYFYTCTVY